MTNHIVLTIDMPSPVDRYGDVTLITLTPSGNKQYTLTRIDDVTYEGYIDISPGIYLIEINLDWDIQIGTLNGSGLNVVLYQGLSVVKGWGFGSIHYGTDYPTYTLNSTEFKFNQATMVTESF